MKLFGQDEFHQEMFHDGHELDHIVAEFVDPGQDIGGEFRKGADAMFCGGDAD